MYMHIWIVCIQSLKCGNALIGTRWSGRVGVDRDVFYIGKQGVEIFFWQNAGDLLINTS